MIYRVFRRTWWKENKNGGWPNNLEPCPGKRRYLRGVSFGSASDARAYCHGLNDRENLTARERRLGLKFEFTSE